MFDRLGVEAVMRGPGVAHGHGAGRVDALRLQRAAGIEERGRAAGDDTLALPVAIEDAGAGGADLETDQTVVMCLLCVQAVPPFSAAPSLRTHARIVRALPGRRGWVRLKILLRIGGERHRSGAHSAGRAFSPLGGALIGHPLRACITRMLSFLDGAPQHRFWPAFSASCRREHPCLGVPAAVGAHDERIQARLRDYRQHHSFSPRKQFGVSGPLRGLLLVRAELEKMFVDALIYGQPQRPVPARAAA